MKKLSLLLGLSILVIMLCDSAKTSPQPERMENATAHLIKTPIISPVKLNRELSRSELSDSELEPLTAPQEAYASETPEAVFPEADESFAASPAQPESAAESKPEKPSIKETAPAVPQVDSGLPGFDDVPYLGPNVCIYVEDMYENGNKIGIMGDINKQVGIMD